MIQFYKWSVLTSYIKICYCFIYIIFYIDIPDQALFAHKQNKNLVIFHDFQALFAHKLNQTLVIFHDFYDKSSHIS